VLYDDMINIITTCRFTAFIPTSQRCTGQ